MDTTVIMTEPKTKPIEEYGKKRGINEYNNIDNI